MINIRRLFLLWILLMFSCFSTGICRPNRSVNNSGKVNSFSKRSKRQKSINPSNLADQKGSAQNTSFSEKNFVSEGQKENLKKLQSDLAQLSSQANVTNEQKQSFVNSFQTLAKGTVKPSKTLVDSLVNDLQLVLSDGNVSVQEQIKLLKDVQSVMNSANIPKSEVDAVINDAKSIMVSSGIGQDDVSLIINDLNSISAELKKNSSSLLPSEPSSKRNLRRIRP